MFTVEYLNVYKNEWLPLVAHPYKTYTAAMNAAARVVRNGMMSRDVRVREVHKEEQ